MSAVINSRRAKPKQDEKKFHHNPLESDESLDGYESDGFHGAYDELLDSAEYAGNEKFAAATGPQKTNGFVKASSVLGKYEVSDRFCTAILPFAFPRSVRLQCMSI